LIFQLLTLRKKNPFLFNLIIVLLLCTGLYILFFASLGFITHHGEEIKVPNVIGKELHEAASIIKSSSFDLFVDSAGSGF